MRLLLCLLAGLYASSAWGQEFGCGFGLGPEGVSGASGTSSHNVAYYQSGTIKPLILFGTFKGVAGKTLTKLQNRELFENQSVANLLDATHEGSLAHYFNAMSYGRLTLAPGRAGVPTTWVPSNQSCVENYVNPPSTPPPTPLPCVPNPSCGTNFNGWHPGVSTFVQEVLANADRTIDFGPYDADNDGEVDLVAVITPEAFGNTCDDRNGTVLYASYSSTDVNAHGNPVTVKRVITSDYRISFPFIVGVLAHEYGHVMGLPELFDRSHSVGNDPMAANHSAGIGRWGTMAKGANGWNHIVRRGGNSARAVDGPNPLCAWSRIELGWITDSPTATDDRLDTVTGDIDLSIHDINSANGKVYKIEVSTDEYFLVANRQNTHNETKPTPVGSYYDEYAPASGLLIWHVDETVRRGSNDVNHDEEHKRVDLECADGLFDMGGFDTAGNSKNSISGGDNLDYWANDANVTYRKNNNGNFGDATDMWDGSPHTDFTPYTNPSTAGYDGNRQSEFTGIAVRNITQNTTDGSVSVKIRFIPSAPAVDKTSLRQGTGEKWNEVSLSWPEPTNASAIDKYQYSIDENIDGNTDWQDFSPSPTGTNTVRGTIALSATDTKVDYTFRVRAVNKQTAPDPDEVSTPSAGMPFTLDRPGQVTLPPSRTLATPTVGDMLTATPTDPNMSESDWDDDDVSWQWQRRIVGVPVWTGANISGATNASYTLTAEDGGHEVRATVRYNDAVGDEDMAASVPVAVPDAPPSANGETSLATDENIDSNTTGPVDLSIYTNTDPNPNAPVWSLTGADADYFNLVQTSSNAAHERTLQFKQPPNYEVPLEGGGYKTTYNVGVKVADTPLSGAAGTGGDALAAILPVTVTVTNVEEAGSVVLSPLPPQVGVALVAQLTDPDEGLTFTGASWTWQRRVDGTSDWEPVPPGAVGATDNYPELSSYTPQMADVGYQLQAMVDYDDNHGPDKRAESAPTVAVVSSNRPPVLTGFAEASVSEGRIRVTTYRASDPDKDSLVWSLGGTDAAAFELFGSGQARTLRLQAAADFEQQATYSLTVGVSDGSRSATLDVTVRVKNIEEAGRVALISTQPQVGTPLTATLSDPDGSITGAAWQWQRRVDDTADWEDVAAGVAGTSGVAELSSYTPQAGDVGFMLQATVRYRDGHSNATKTAESGATEAVVGPPVAVASLTAVPGDGQVVLGWQAPASDGGEPISGYEYRQSKDGGTTWQPDWMAIADSDAETTGHTVEDLTNDTAYTFAVRAVNAVRWAQGRRVVRWPRRCRPTSRRSLWVRRRRQSAKAARK